ncbi:MAG: OmpA family protein [Nitrospirota bacterium]
MHVFVARKILIAAVLFSFLFLIGCAGMEFAPKNGIWYYPKDLVAADKAVKEAKAAGKEKVCPVEFREAKQLKKDAYETYWACNDKKAIAMAKDAAAKARALCPAKPKREMGEKVIDRLTITVNFDFDKARIRQADMAQLKKAMAFIKKYPGAKIRLEGHTDWTGTEAYNQRLSERRAEAVKKYLAKDGKTDASRISTMGYGETKPVASNKTRQGRAKNRRVEILILAD